VLSLAIAGVLVILLFVRRGCFRSHPLHSAVENVFRDDCTFTELADCLLYVHSVYKILLKFILLK